MDNETKRDEPTEQQKEQMEKIKRILAETEWKYIPFRECFVWLYNVEKRFITENDIGPVTRENMLVRMDIPEIFVAMMRECNKLFKTYCNKPPSKREKMCLRNSKMNRIEILSFIAKFYKFFDNIVDDSKLNKDFFEECINCLAVTNRVYEQFIDLFDWGTSSLYNEVSDLMDGMFVISQNVPLRDSLAMLSEDVPTTSAVRNIFEAAGIAPTNEPANLKAAEVKNNSSSISVQTENTQPAKCKECTATEKSYEQLLEKISLKKNILQEVENEVQKAAESNKTLKHSITLLEAETKGAQEAERTAERKKEKIRDLEKTFEHATAPNTERELLSLRDQEVQLRRSNDSKEAEIKRLEEQLRMHDLNRDYLIETINKTERQIERETTRQNEIKVNLDDLNATISEVKAQRANNRGRNEEQEEHDEEVEEEIGQRDQQVEEENEEDLECSICLGEIIDAEPVMICPGCLKSHHDLCMLEWLSRSPSCPYCRHRIVNPEEYPQLGAN